MHVRWPVKHRAHLHLCQWTEVIQAWLPQSSLGKGLLVVWELGDARPRCLVGSAQGLEDFVQLVDLLQIPQRMNLRPAASRG